MNKKEILERRIKLVLQYLDKPYLEAIIVRYNGQKVSVYITEKGTDQKWSYGLQDNIPEDILDKILSCPGQKIEGDYFGEGFSGWKAEEINFRD